MLGSTRLSGNYSTSLRPPCLAVSSRWNGLWNCTGAPAIPSACPTRWRTWEMPWLPITSGNEQRRPSNSSSTANRRAIRQSGSSMACSAKWDSWRPDQRRNFPWRTCGQRFIAQSLTDVDLFASYGLTQKAIGLLEAILRRAPRHTPTLEKLLDFVLGAGDDRRTAELAAQLQQIHGETGDKRSSERFGELRRRFQRAAGLTDEELASAVPPARPAAPEAEPEPADVSIPEIAAEPVPEEPAPAPPVEKTRLEPVGVNAAPA